jgi:hypothetical protein
MTPPRDQATAPAPSSRALAAAGTAAAAPAPSPMPAGAGAPVAAVPRRRSDTRRALGRLTAAVIAGCLLFGVIGAICFWSLASSLGSADANAKQLIRVQQIETNLLLADATETNAFLVGGLEPATQRAAYEKAVSDTSALIAQAAEAQPADRDALAALNRTVVDYTGTVEQARANNRQGFPVGAQYLRNASAALRADALPILANLVQANSARAAGEMSSDESTLFDLVGLATVVLLVFAMVWLARRFRRTINPGLLAATTLVLGAFLIGAIVLSVLHSRVSDVRSGAFRSLEDSSNARIAAYDGKSNESLTLIARGSGTAFEKAWATSRADVDEDLTRLDDAGLSSRWASYTAVHRTIRSLDDGGRWDRAVGVATGTGAGSSNGAFAAFDASATALLGRAAERTSSDLRGPRTLLYAFAVLSLIAGAGAALLARGGLAARLREYR